MRIATRYYIQSNNLQRRLFQSHFLALSRPLEKKMKKILKKCWLFVKIKLFYSHQTLNPQKRKNKMATTKKTVAKKPAAKKAVAKKAPAKKAAKK